MKIEVKLSRSIDLFELTEEEAYEFFEQKVGEIMYYYDKGTNSWYHLTEGDTTTYVKDESLLTILFKHMIDTVEAKLLEDVLEGTWESSMKDACVTTFTLGEKQYDYHNLLSYLVRNIILTTPTIGKEPKPEDYGYNNGGLYKEAEWEIAGGEEAYGKAIDEWEKANDDLDIDKPDFD